MKIPARNAVEVSRCRGFAEWFKWSGNEIVFFACRTIQSAKLHTFEPFSPTWHLITRLARYTRVLMPTGSLNYSNLENYSTLPIIYARTRAALKPNAVCWKLLYCAPLITEVLFNLARSSFQLSFKENFFNFTRQQLAEVAPCFRDQNNWTRALRAFTSFEVSLQREVL